MCVCVHIVFVAVIFLNFFSFRLDLKGNKEVYESGFCLDNECWRLYEHKVHNVLTQGMRDRVKSVRVIWRNMPSECTIENVWEALYCIILYEIFVAYS